jgi:predicted ATP-grasp superfamily ATP-dependent carboligase
VTTDPRVSYVVLRSNDVCFLGICRALAHAGATVVPVTYSWEGAGPWHSDKSLHVRVPYRINNPHEDHERAAEELLSLGRRLMLDFGARPLLVPSSDTNIAFFLLHEARLREYFDFLGGVDWRSARADVVDKFSCDETLREAGVPTPHTLRCFDENDLSRLTLREGNYIYKPALKDTGQRFYAAHAGAKCVDLQRDRFREQLRSELNQGFPLVVQEKLDIKSSHDEIPIYCYVDAAHRVHGLTGAYKAQLDPEPFGTATRLELVQADQHLKLAQTVARALKWRGLLMIELIFDRASGKHLVIEVNTRPWLLIDFWRRSGLNYLELLHRDRQGTLSACESSGYDKLRPALHHVMLTQALAQPRPEFFEDGRRTIEALLYYLRVPERQLSFAYLDPDDPEPGRCEIESVAETFAWSATELCQRLEACAASY